MNLEFLVPELLGIVVDYLNARDLGNFRRTCRRFAEFGVAYIPRNGLSLLNISEGFQELQQALEGSIHMATRTEKLVFYDGEWPQCSQREWKTHPLLFRGNSRIEAFEKSKVNKAFANYSAFVRREGKRSHYKDANDLSTILTLLPNLQSMIISDMQYWVWHPSRYLRYSRLQERIWITPYFDHSVAPAVQIFLQAAHGKFANIKNLSINGSLDLAEVELDWSGVSLPHIQRLNINSLCISYNEEDVQKFLQAFPNLVELSLNFENWGSSVPKMMSPLFWAHLERLYLSAICSSEEDIFGVFRAHQHSLTKFGLRNSRLTQGTWWSLFTKIRALHSPAVVDAEGKFYEQTEEQTLYIGKEAKSLLAKFLSDLDTFWPFEKGGKER
jgi:hypothetical protein